MILAKTLGAGLCTILGPEWAEQIEGWLLDFDGQPCTGLRATGTAMGGFLRKGTTLLSFELSGIPEWLSHHSNPPCAQEVS